MKSPSGINGPTGKKEVPQVKNQMTRWYASFSRAFKKRESRLPRETVGTYIMELLEKREWFLNSVSRFHSPQYFFDQPALQAQVSSFQEAFSEQIRRFRAYYAVKSNSFEGICRQVVKGGMGLDVSSGLELSRALQTGCTRIIFSGPGKTDDELALAFEHRDKVTLHLDSFGELERLTLLPARVRAGEKPLEVGVRVHSSRSGSWSKFGIPLRHLVPMLKRIEGIDGIVASGIQFHTSWNLDPSPQIRMIEEISAHVRQRVPKRLWTSLSFLDIGGGFWPEQGEWLNAAHTTRGRLLQLLDPEARLNRAHYRRPSHPISSFARDIARTLAGEGEPLSHMEVWVEPGRWISTPAMHILLKVIDKKNQGTVITDGGISMLGWERPLSEFIPVVNLSRPSIREIKTNVFGSLCTPDDVWGFSIFGEGIETGDILLIPDQGAYTYSLRQSFIKPRSRVVCFDGRRIEEAERESGS